MRPHAAIRCVAINAGDGYKLAKGFEIEADGSPGVTARYIEYLLRNEILTMDRDSIPSNTQAWNGPQAAVLNWVELERSRLDSLCTALQKIDPSFAKCKREHEARNDPLGWRADEDVPHTMDVAIAARHSLKQLEDLLTDRSWLKADAEHSAGPYAQASHILKIAKRAYRAGQRAQELQAIAASYPTLSKLGSMKGIKRTMGARAEFILEQEAELRTKLKRNPSTVELMQHLDQKIDPESTQRITSSQDEDETWVIRWSDNSSQTQKQFASKVSELRNKKSKKVH